MPRSECINVSPRANDEGCGASGWQDRLLACSTHSGRFSEIDEVYGEESDIPCRRPCLVSGHIGALSSFRERGEMSPHKRAIRHLTVKSASRPLVNECAMLEESRLYGNLPEAKPNRLGE